VTLSDFATSRALIYTVGPWHTLMKTLGILLVDHCKTKVALILGPWRAAITISFTDELDIVLHKIFLVGLSL